MARKTLIQVRRDTAANWTSANPTLSAGEWGFESNTGKVKMGDGSTAWASLSYFIPGVGAGGTVAADAIWDAKGDLAVGTGSDTASKLTAGSNGKLLVAASGESTGLKWDTGYLGGLELVYKYTVTGSDKASVDTGVDTADAGTNDFTNGDVLEIFVYSRTDEAVTSSVLKLVINNDTAANYDRQSFSASGASVSGSQNLGEGAVLLVTSGASSAANYFGHAQLAIPNYAGTVGYKEFTALYGNATGSGVAQSQAAAFAYKSTSAITRISIIPNTAAKKLKVGSQLLIYKRRNA